MDRLAVIEEFAKLGGYMSRERRESLPSKAFAVPESKAKKIGVGGEIQGEAKGKYPVPDEKHARNALARVSQHGTPAEREAVRNKVYSKYPGLREGFEERHGESPTSKKNVKKVEQGGIGKGGCMGTKMAMLSAFYDELEKVGAAGLTPEELEKFAGVFERLGLLTQRGAGRAGGALKRGYESAQVGVGNIMSGHHGHGIEHAMQKIPTGSPSKMLMAYAGDPHVQKAVAGHVSRGAQAVGRGAQRMGRKIREAVTPAPQPAFAR
jgi:hypothetical protein